MNNFLKLNSKWLIIGASVVLAVLVYVFGTRYSPVQYRGVTGSFDRFSGRIIKAQSDKEFPKSNAENNDGPWNDYKNQDLKPTPATKP